MTKTNQECLCPSDTLIQCKHTNTIEPMNSHVQKQCYETISVGRSSINNNKKSLVGHQRNNFQSCEYTNSKTHEGKILFIQVHDAIQESCIACDAHLASTDSCLRRCFAQDKQKQVSDNTKPQTQ